MLTDDSLSHLKELSFTYCW